MLLRLSQALPAPSFAFVPALRDLALGGIDRLETPAGPGRYRYAVLLGEQLRLLRPEGEGAQAMRAWPRRLAADGPSGDVHAWLLA